MLIIFTIYSILLPLVLTQDYEITELCSYHSEPNSEIYIQCGVLKASQDHLKSDDVTKIQKIQMAWNTTLPQLSYGLFTPFTSLTTLILNNMNIKEIDTRAFYNMNQLRELSFFNNKISIINSSSFNQLYVLRVLDLGSNKLQYLQDNVFSNLNLLEELYLSWNNIVNITKGIFNGLPHLKILSLKGNGIQIIKINVFENLGYLKSLDLSYNNIKEIPFMLFASLINLQTLNLNSNALKTLPKRLFDNNSELRDLDISSNFLNNINENMFSNTVLETFKFERNLISHLNMSLLLNSAQYLEELYFDVNPWNCKSLNSIIRELQLMHIYFEPGILSKNKPDTYGIMCRDDDI